MFPLADMLLVTLLDTGVEVLMSKKNTSSLVEDVRLTVSSNSVASFSCPESCVSMSILSHSSEDMLESSKSGSKNLLVSDLLAVDVMVIKDESDETSLVSRSGVWALMELSTLFKLLLEFL